MIQLKKKKEINIVNMIDIATAKVKINNYGELIKTQHKRVIAFIVKQAQTLKKFKDVEKFFLEFRTKQIYDLLQNKTLQVLNKTSLIKNLPSR